MPPSLSIIIPCYNEANNIGLTLEEINKAFHQVKIKYEIIVVDDKSVDMTAFNVIEKKKSIPNLVLIENGHNLGFSSSYFVGVQNAQNEFCMYIPGDNDLESNELLKIINNIDSTDAIIVNYQNKNDRKLTRRLISTFYTFLINLITKNNFKYYNGFNVYRTNQLKAINVKSKSFSFQAEIILELIKNKISYKQITANCKFNDTKTTAFKLKNIYQVSLFIINLFFQYRIKYAS